jgi:hypothetical protein
MDPLGYQVAAIALGLGLFCWVWIMLADFFQRQEADARKEHWIERLPRVPARDEEYITGRTVHTLGTRAFFCHH